MPTTSCLTRRCTMITSGYGVPNGYDNPISRLTENVLNRFDKPSVLKPIMNRGGARKG